MQTEGGGKMPPVADREEILHFYTGVMRGKIYSGGKAAAILGTCALLSEVDWRMTASAAALAGLLSLLMSLSGLPEEE